MNRFIPEEKENPIVTLRAQAEKFDFSKLRAGKDNAEANSGNTAFCDLRRMDFVINGKSISRDLIAELYKEHDSLLPKNEDKSYRPFAKAVFKQMFEHAGVKVPSDPILEELVTNCNQAGYVGALYAEDKPLFHVATAHELVFGSSHTTYIDCSDPSHATIRIEEKIAVCTLTKPEEELCKLDSSLEFTLQSQDEKDDVTYKDGKLLLTAPKRLKDYNMGDKNLFDIIKECFQKLCEKLGFFKIKIEHGLGDLLEVNSCVEDPNVDHLSNKHGTPGIDD